MYLIIFKTVAAIGIFLLTLIAGLFPLKIAKTKTHLLCLGDSFANGVFLSAALLHLLPEADEGFRDILGDHTFPFAQLICVIIFVLLLVMERGICTYNKHHPSDSRIAMPLFLILLLTIHSLIEGAVIGTTTNLAEASMIFFAVFAHKGSESFALTVNLHHYKLSEKNIQKIISVFSFVTPIGIFIASLIMYTLQTSPGSAIGPVFNAITAGTFLYFGTEHMTEEAKSFESPMEILVLILGIVPIAIMKMVH